MIGPSEPEPVGLDAAAHPPGEGVFRALFERSPEAILLVGADGRCLDANPAGCALLGYRRDDIAGLAFGRLSAGGLPRADEPDPVRLSLRRRAGGSVRARARRAELDPSRGLVALFLDPDPPPDPTATALGDGG